MKIVNIGCAEGYYAVGFALKSSKSAVFAYDVSPKARQQCLAMAQLNKVVERLVIRERCGATELNSISGSKTLIFCDIEGSEIELLDPKIIPILRETDIIVEIHNDLAFGAAELILRRFLSTHHIDIIYYSTALTQSYPVLDKVPSDLREFMLDELRFKGQSWLRMCYSGEHVRA